MVERRESDRAVRAVRAVRCSLWSIGLAKTVEAGEAGERRETPARELGGKACPERSEGAGGREGGRLASLIDQHRFRLPSPRRSVFALSAAEAATRLPVAEATLLPPSIYFRPPVRPVRLVRPSRPPALTPSRPLPLPTSSPSALRTRHAARVADDRAGALRANSYSVVG